MCKRHYEFYAKNPITAQRMEEVLALEDGTANWKLIGKTIIQSLIHHSLNISMPLIEHFPLEHVFQAEAYSLRHNESVDSERVKEVIKDFDIPETDYASGMKRGLNIKDVETSDIGQKDDYLLRRKDLPAKWPVILSLLGFVLLFCFYEWLASPDIWIEDKGLADINGIFRKLLPLGGALQFFIFLGVLIPSKYNFFVEKCYNMTMFKTLEDNVDVLNQIRFVKERKGRSKDYYIAVYISAIWGMLIVVGSLLMRNSTITWNSLLFYIGLSLIVFSLFFSYNEMALFYPVIESIKRKHVAIDLYNADHRGGLKYYHRFLYLTFFYNEGLIVTLLILLNFLDASFWWYLATAFFLVFRFNHAGWSLAGWIRSIVDFYKEKRDEQNRLIALEGSSENMSKMEQLNKTYPIGLIPILIFIVSSIIIPYVVNQLPKLSELIESIGKYLTWE